MLYTSDFRYANQSFFFSVELSKCLCNLKQEKQCIMSIQVHLSKKRRINKIRISTIRSTEINIILLIKLYNFPLSFEEKFPDCVKVRIYYSY